MTGVYDEFLSEITPEDWEYFALDFLGEFGFIGISQPSRGPDGGQDAIVQKNDKIYIVSCKHYINSNTAVGVTHEISIIDRITQHNADGFIGFYSTVVSSGLYERFNALSQHEFEYNIFDKHRISELLPEVSSSFFQKYSSPAKIRNNLRFPFNVEKHQYLPINCLECNKDILSNELIGRASAYVYLNQNSELDYVYGCKDCILQYICDLGSIEVSQALHQEQFNSWVRYVNDLQVKYTLAPSFFKNKDQFESRLPQRSMPSNWGQWL